MKANKTVRKLLVEDRLTLLCRNGNKLYYFYKEDCFRVVYRMNVLFHGEDLKSAIKVFKKISLDHFMYLGNYKGRRIVNIIKNDPEYIDWCIDNIKDFILDKEAQRLFDECLEEFRTESGYYDWPDPADGW